LSFARNLAIHSRFCRWRRIFASAARRTSAAFDEEDDRSLFVAIVASRLVGYLWNHPRTIPYGVLTELRSASMPFVKYSGPRKEHRPHNRTREYGPDRFVPAPQPQHLPTGRTGSHSSAAADWHYEFNSLGFRSQEYDQNADVDIFVVGCSNTLGVGVVADHTWPRRFVELYLKDRPGTTACLMNFAQGSASNDYIARTAVVQSNAVRPGLLLVNFTGVARKEHIDGLRVSNLLPTGALDEVACPFYSLYTDEEGVINAVKNILLTQFHCRSRAIPFLFAWSDHRILRSSRFQRHPVCGPLLALVDRDRFCEYGMKDDDVFVDKARDLVHPGPRSHRRFAERMYERFTRLEKRD